MARSKKLRIAEINIRWMKTRDMPEVLRIEKESFNSPWTINDFYRVSQSRNCSKFIVELNGSIAGFIISESYRAKMEIINFAIAKRWRRSGIGTQVIQKLIENLSERQQKYRIFLTLRETNLRAQLFFHKLGFEAVRILHNFYEDSGEDGFLMEYHLRDPNEDTFPIRNRITRWL